MKVDQGAGCLVLTALLAAGRVQDSNGNGAGRALDSRVLYVMDPVHLVTRDLMDAKHVKVVSALIMEVDPASEMQVGKPLQKF
jgi:hypothetical protein